MTHQFLPVEIVFDYLYWVSQKISRNMLLILLMLILLNIDIVYAISFNKIKKATGFSPKESKLLNILEADGVQNTRGATISLESSNEIEMLVSQLENSGASIKDPTTSPLLDGVWKLLYTSSPGTNSPIQRTFTSNDAVSVYQVVNLINIENSFLSGEPDVSNVVTFGDKARLRVTAIASTSTKRTVVPRKGDGKILGLNIFGVSSSKPPKSASDRIDFAFQEARIEFPGTDKFIPYPVPFKLLGDEAKGWIDTTYLSPSGDFRIAKGNKGTTFILKRASPTDSTALFAKAPILNDSSSYKRQIITEILNSNKTKKKTKVSIILPAQLCSDDDYVELTDNLMKYNPKSKIKYYTVKLNRLDWVGGLLPSFFSKNYFDGTLVPSKTLEFYLKKVDEAVIQAIEENGNVDISLIAHSIGGWVGRCWLSEHASPELKSTISKMITLGTPHNPPPLGSIDQTRGLIKYIDQQYPGAFEKGVQYYSIIGTGTKGNIGVGSGLINTIEEILGYISYSVLSGNGNDIGDGLIPVDSASLAGAKLISIDSVKHSDFVPSPLGKSFKLNLPWYGNPEAIQKWGDILK